MDAPDVKGKRITVVGFGIEGQALVRFLVGKGAQVTVSDVRTSDVLAEGLQQIQGLPVRLSLGANRVEDTVNADAVFVSQGVPLDIPALVAARDSGVPIGSMTKLSMELCPGTIVGITGSAGKTTTTALTGEILRQAGLSVFAGGNIGVSLLDRLEEMGEDSWAVMEISHTQLEIFGRCPHIAVVTNIAPSHADRYPNLEEYIALKKSIFRGQSRDDYTVLNYDDPVTRAMAAEAPAQVLFFSRFQDHGEAGAFIQDEWVMVRHLGEVERVLPVEKVKLLGRHNLDNVLAACACAALCGVETTIAAKAVASFPGVEHRLEWVRCAAGVDYYNDSIATSPQRALAGIQAFSRPLVLIAGGRDKDLPLEELAAGIGERCRAVVLYGEAATSLEKAIRDAAVPARGPAIIQVASFSDTVKAARAAARGGDVVLLSPACTSFDSFANFEARGKEFKNLVAQLED